MDDVSISEFLIQAKNLWYNGSMYCKKSGFTLIEVALFLAITGALFVGIMGGVQNSIFQQRMNDSVQNFIEFLRTAYSETMNVQSLGKGQSNNATYGKLITFGESRGLNDENWSGTDNDSRRNHIYMYDVIGRIDAEKEISTTSGALQMLKNLGANVMTKEDNEIKLNGIVESYTPKWGAVIEDKDGGLFKGSLLIIRHPNSGVVYTFFNNVAIEVNQNRIAGEKLDADWTTTGFNIGKVDFCINPTGEEGFLNRQDVRIIENARSGSGIELVPESSEDNACNGGGN